MDEKEAIRGIEAQAKQYINATPSRVLFELIQKKEWLIRQLIDTQTAIDATNKALQF